MLFKIFDLFQQIPDLYSIIGAVLIFVAVIFSALKKIREGLSNENILKKNKIMALCFEPILQPGRIHHAKKTPVQKTPCREFTPIPKH